MNADDLIMISVDDHVVEPPEMFRGHIPAAYADQAPKVVRTDDGADVWVFNGSVIPNIGLNAVAGRPKEEYGIEPTAFDEVRPGCYDINERVKDMSAGGILASMNFPSFPGFSGRVFATAQDKGLALAVLRAYNDWHIDEWAGAYPGRIIPMAHSSWPNAPEELAAVTTGVPDFELDKITYQNAMRWYSFDPFAFRPKEQCTVGALRAEVSGHDVSIRSRDKGRFTKSVGVNIGTLAGSATA